MKLFAKSSVYSFVIKRIVTTNIIHVIASGNLSAIDISLYLDRVGFSSKNYSIAARTYFANNKAYVRGFRSSDKTTVGFTSGPGLYLLVPLAAYKTASAVNLAFYFHLALCRIAGKYMVLSMETANECSDRSIVGRSNDNFAVIIATCNMATTTSNATNSYLGNAINSDFAGIGALVGSTDGACSFNTWPSYYSANG